MNLLTLLTSGWVWTMLSWKTNWMIIFPYRLRMLLTPLSGGETTEGCIRTCHGWHLITRVFLVRASRYHCHHTNFHILATSTAVERVFSQGRQMLHFTRNCMSGTAIRNLLCLGSWCRNDLVVTDDLLSAIGHEKGEHSVIEIEIYTDNEFE
jgi:hypothetical protein